MIRPRAKANAHLPPRMQQRVMKSGTVHYYYRTRNGGKIALGSDLAEARDKWAQLERNDRLDPLDKWTVVSARYRREGMKDLAGKTQKEYTLALDRLDKAFAAARLPQIKPHHVRQYLDRRSAKVAANREIALLSAVFNWARERGITDAPNPIAGVRKHSERARGRYVTDAEFDALYKVSPPELRDALDLARLTGQREADILRMRSADVRDGYLHVMPRKTAKRTAKLLRIALVGELAQVVERMLASSTRGLHGQLVQTPEGKAMTYAMLRNRFDAARAASGQNWQFRDLRPKAATDTDNVRDAQQLLGHASEATTAKIYRRLKGEAVQPVGGKRK